jgi:hypothetical protein
MICLISLDTWVIEIKLEIKTFSKKKIIKNKFEIIDLKYVN